MEIRLTTIRLEDIVCLDTEASGLHGTSYPIELGWCRLDLKSESALIRPEPAWSSDDWNYESEKIHGIPHGTLMVNGEAARVVFDRLQAFRGPTGILVSDNPYYETMWMTRLCEAIGQECPLFYHYDHVVAGLISTEQKMWQKEPELLRAFSLVEAHYPHVHRAGPDALSMAAKIRVLVDAGFLATLAGRAEEIVA